MSNPFAELKDLINGMITEGTSTPKPEEAVSEFQSTIQTLVTAKEELEKPVEEVTFPGYVAPAKAVPKAKAAAVTAAAPAAAAVKTTKEFPITKAEYDLMIATRDSLLASVDACRSSIWEADTDKARYTLAGYLQKFLTIIDWIEDYLEIHQVVESR
jgi:hypothetical protein